MTAPVFGEVLRSPHTRKQGTQLFMAHTGRHRETQTDRQTHKPPTPPHMHTRTTRDKGHAQQCVITARSNLAKCPSLTAPVHAHKGRGTRNSRSIKNKGKSKAQNQKANAQSTGRKRAGDEQYKRRRRRRGGGGGGGGRRERRRERKKGCVYVFVCLQRCSDPLEERSPVGHDLAVPTARRAPIALPPRQLNSDCTRHATQR